MEKINYKRFILVKDNFYSDPVKVYKAALKSEFHEPLDCTGLRSKKVYHEPGVKAKLEKILGIKINRWDVDPEEENGVFYQGFSKGNKKEIKNRSKLIETDRIGYKYNRMVAYPSGALHSATQHYGGTLKDGRIYQTFRIGVDWKTFKMNRA